MPYDPFLYRSPEGYAVLEKWYEEALRAFRVPIKTGYVPTRFGETHVISAGAETAPPLVLIHGYGAGSPFWRQQIEGLAGHYRLYAPDCVGHPGRSATRPPSLLDDGWSLWLQDVLDALGLARAALAGVCLGGWMVMRFAAFAPERVTHAILLSPVGIAPFRIYWRSGVPLVLNLRNDPSVFGQRLMRMVFAPPGSGLKFNREVFHALSLVVKHYNAGALAGMSAKPTWREILRGTRALVKFVRGEPRGVLQRVRVPTLLLVGQHEGIFDARKAVRRAQRHMPNVRAEILPDVGHAVIFDAAEQVNARIHQFLASESSILFS
ncbi:MAG: alpha/beta hydrolase [Chloroflexota bacterium]|nr:MAG: alpha/beta hydrolase [Chloroflexota bacterium]